MSVENKKILPRLFKPSSDFIQNIKAQPDFEISQIVNGLNDTKKFWEDVQKNKQSLPESLISDMDNKINEIKEYKKQNLECIRIVKRKITLEKYNEFINKDSELNKKAGKEYAKMKKQGILRARQRKYLRETGYETKMEFYIAKSFKYLMLGIFIYYIGWVLFAEKEKCTRVTYQDFDSNGNIVTKKGQVCGDARHKINDRWKDD
tara:strand:- start:377 stop:991 length:615 start_codon:yes stop_codon:yes gene_type:complete